MIADEEVMWNCSEKRNCVAYDVNEDEHRFSPGHHCALVPCMIFDLCSNICHLKQVIHKQKWKNPKETF